MGLGFGLGFGFGFGLGFEFGLGFGKGSGSGSTLLAAWRAPLADRTPQALQRQLTRVQHVPPQQAALVRQLLV